MISLLLWLSFSPAGAEALPDWAAGYHALSGDPTGPVRADVVCIAERYEFSYDEEGRVLRRHRIVYRVNRQGGARDASTYYAPGGNDKGKLHRLRGWHVNRRGEVDVLDHTRLAIVGLSQGGNLMDETVAAVSFERVASGSVVIFESLYREKSFMGPISTISVLGTYPSDRLTIGFADGSTIGRIVPSGFEAWGLKPKMIDGELLLEQLPGLGEASERAPFADLYPRALVLFTGTGEDVPSYASWDSFAAWYWSVFEDAALTSPAPKAGAVSLDDLRAVVTRVCERIVYRQVYLSHARGYVPDKGTEVMRRAYGDCKDIVSCTAHLAAERAILVRPALANIVTGPFSTEEDPPSPAFNHLISAIPLTMSLGLPAEVEAGGHRYLLFDGTAPTTRFGYLPRG